MILVFIFFVFFIGIICSKVSVYIDSFNYTNDLKIKNAKYNVKLVFKLFEVIPFIVIRFKNDEIRLFGIKVDTNKIIQSKEFEKKMEKAKNSFRISRIKYLDPNLEKFNLRLDLGTESIFVTSILVAWLGIFFGYFLQKRIKRFDKNKYKYIVKPNFEEKNQILIDFNAVLDVKTSNIIECFRYN